MSINLGFVDEYLREHSRELLMEAEAARLADLATGPGRPLRIRLARYLRAAAVWVEGAPRQPTVALHAEG